MVTVNSAGLKGALSTGNVVDLVAGALVTGSLGSSILSGGNEGTLRGEMLFSSITNIMGLTLTSAI